MKRQTPYQKRFQKLCSEIAKREDGKSKVRIGDVREVMRILLDPYFFYLFLHLAFHQGAEPKKKKRRRK